jgi:polyribonucleotide nucleotidyltransferase
MNETISQARPELADNAPRINIIEIPLDKIGDVIGPGGKIIRGITASTGAKIDIDDTGTVGKVMIASSNAEAMAKAVEMVQYYTEEVEMGKLYLGRVARIMGFGAFVEILPGKEGMVHISQLAESRVETVEDVINIGDEIWVKVMEIDDQGRVNLSHKLALREMRGEPFDESDYQPRAGGGKSRDSRGGRNDRGGRGGGGGRGRNDRDRGRR